MNYLKPSFAKTRFLPMASLLLALGLPAAPVMADSMASKLEQLGEMTYLKITDMRVVQRNGLLNIQVEVTNTSDTNERLFYRFKWLDSTGFSVWDEEPWKPVLIYGRQKHLITVVAPTPQATDFRLVLQSPNNDTTNSNSTWSNP
ncbi:MAG: YcfL family protein [Sulfuricellaceae bacterium]|nr:YcfL family protein [Sulfuricellaceae bacterium]